MVNFFKYIFYIYIYVLSYLSNNTGGKMTRILAIFAILFAFAAPSAMAKNDYSCDKKFIFFPGGPEGGPFGTSHLSKIIYIDL